MSPRISPFGRHGLLVDQVGGDPTALVAQLRTAHPTLAIRPGMDSVLLTGADLPDPAVLAREIDQARTAEALPVRAPRLVAVHYDGQDLATVADLLGLSTDGLVAAHTGLLWRVALIGFAPGFPYLVPADGARSVFADVPRLASPRASVPAGSVAVAAGMSCIYPQALPGGWQLLGRTDLVLFDLSRDDQPSLLRAGDLVQFTAVRR